MKVLGIYLPQYHTFPENDEWWGEGFTEWTSVKRGRPLYPGHAQPRVPQNDHYYDLVKDGAATWSWQASLAKQYGVYGFCIYHYWFCGKQLMEKPMEILREHGEIPLRYCICWANETWTKTWYERADVVLMKQEYGNREDWERHFAYLNQFFQDERYIKVDNKPVLNIYRTMDIPCLKEMLTCFRELAVKAGFDGLYVVSARTAGELETRTELVDAFYEFEPGYTLKHWLGGLQTKRYELGVLAKTIYNRLFKKEVLERRIPADWIYRGIMERKDAQENVFPGLFADWDNTPRRSYKGLVYEGTSPERFAECLRVLRERVRGRKVDFVYVNAWNEWGEGAYLEPDELRGAKYLEAVKSVVSEQNR